MLPKSIGSVELNGSIDVLPDTETTYTVTAKGLGYSSFKPSEAFPVREPILFLAG